MYGAHVRTTYEFETIVPLSLHVKRLSFRLHGTPPAGVLAYVSKICQRSAEHARGLRLGAASEVGIEGSHGGERARPVPAVTLSRRGREAWLAGSQQRVFVPFGMHCCGAALRRDGL